MPTTTCKSCEDEFDSDALVKGRCWSCCEEREAGDEPLAVDEFAKRLEARFYGREKEEEDADAEVDL